MLRKVEKPTYKKSEVDELFYDLYGFFPGKQGQSYELIVGAVLKILGFNGEGGSIVWDERHKGQYDGNNYQVDVTVYGANKDDVIAEAKDYSGSERNVGRPEVDKLSGALMELSPEEGLLFSSSGFAKDAKGKAEASMYNPNLKRINLFYLRPSNEEDEENRVKKFSIKFYFKSLDNDSTYMRPVLSESDVKTLFPGKSKIDVIFNLTVYYERDFISFDGSIIEKESGEIVGRLYASKILKKNIYEVAEENHNEIQATWEVDEGWISTDNGEVCFNEMDVVIRFEYKLVSTQEIEPYGDPKILVKDESESVNTLVTDNQLKGVSFGDDGTIDYDGSPP